MDACPGWWQSSQCRLSAPMARQPYTAGPKQISRPEIWVRDLPDHLWAKQFVFSRWRDARLQLVHGLRSGQRCHSGDMDQPHSVARRQAHRQQHHVENARPDLYGIAASLEARYMSDLGHKRTKWHVCPTSALPPEADIGTFTSVQGMTRPARQNHPDFGELARLSVHLDGAAMLLDDNVVTDREAKAGAFSGRLCRKE